VLKKKILDVLCTSCSKLRTVSGWSSTSLSYRAFWSLEDTPTESPELGGGRCWLMMKKRKKKKYGELDALKVPVNQRLSLLSCYLKYEVVVVAVCYVFGLRKGSRYRYK